MVLYLAVPQKAVKGEFQLHQATWNGRNVTEQLNATDIARLEGLVESASCSRWKNPVGVFPADENTAVLLGVDDRGLCVVTLVYETHQFSVSDHRLRDGEALWQKAATILQKY